MVYTCSASTWDWGRRISLSYIGSSRQIYYRAKPYILHVETTSTKNNNMVWCSRGWENHVQIPWWMSGCKTGQAHSWGGVWRPQQGCRIGENIVLLCGDLTSLESREGPDVLHSRYLGASRKGVSGQQQEGQCRCLQHSGSQVTQQPAWIPVPVSPVRCISAVCVHM